MWKKSLKITQNNAIFRKFDTLRPFLLWKTLLKMWKHYVYLQKINGRVRSIGLAETETQMNKNQEEKYISKAVIRRLPRYFRYLRELIRAGIMRISSRELSERMNVTASQIRQDLNCFGGFGQQGYGYNVKYLYKEISHILGVDCGFSAVIVGVGNLGRALIGSPMFERRGVTIKGLFDTDEKIIGQSFGNLSVQSADKIADFCHNEKIDIAILTVPKTAAYDTALALSEAGVKGLWNFSNTEITLPNGGAVIENVHLGDSLMALCYELAKNKTQPQDNAATAPDIKI